RLSRGVDRALHMLVVVGERREPGLEWGWWRVDAALEQAAAEGGMAGRVGGPGAGQIAHRLGGEEEREQAGGPLDGDRDRGLGRSALEAGGEELGRAAEPLVGGRIQQAERRDPGGG